MDWHRRWPPALGASLCLAAAAAAGPAGCAPAAAEPPRWHALPSLPLPENPLDDDDEYDDLDDDPEPTLDSATEARVRAAYAELVQRGRVKEAGWHFREPFPTLTRSARLRIQADSDEGISDGYTRYVVVPLDAQDRPQDEMFITREGGFSGWVQWAGPFVWRPT